MLATLLGHSGRVTCVKWLPGHTEGREAPEHWQAPGCTFKWCTYIGTILTPVKEDAHATLQELSGHWRRAALILPSSSGSGFPLMPTAPGRLLRGSRWGCLGYRARLTYA